MPLESKMSINIKTISIHSAVIVILWSIKSTKRILLTLIKIVFLFFPPPMPAIDTMPVAVQLWLNLCPTVAKEKPAIYYPSAVVSHMFGECCGVCLKIWHRQHRLEDCNFCPQCQGQESDWKVTLNLIPHCNTAIPIVSQIWQALYKLHLKSGKSST